MPDWIDLGIAGHPNQDPPAMPRIVSVGQTENYRRLTGLY
jgi:hypothetical protein